MVVNRRHCQESHNQVRHVMAPARRVPRPGNIGKNLEDTLAGIHYDAGGIHTFQYRSPNNRVRYLGVRFLAMSSMHCVFSR